jgi:uncharacterized protein YneF (UPF0154 family)
MKNDNTVTCIVICLLLGAVLGFFAGYHYHDHQMRKNEILRLEINRNR